jgi:hypothetical protein
MTRSYKTFIDSLANEDHVVKTLGRIADALEALVEGQNGTPGAIAVESLTNAYVQGLEAARGVAQEAHEASLECKPGPGGYFDGRAKGANTIALRIQGLIDEAKRG